jgi:glycosyltransferase involved in cell wall biosynthesis
MKILMIAPQPFFQPRGTPFSVLGRLRALAHLGHEVDLLTYHRGQNVIIPGVAIFRTPPFRFVRDIPIGPSGTKLFLDIFLVVEAYRRLCRKRYDVLHTHEEASFFGILLAKFFQVPHLYDMHSSLPQQLLNFRYTRSRPLIRFFERLERRVILASEAVITICPALAEHVNQISGNVSHVMIENVAIERSTEAVSAEEVRAFRTAHALDGKRIVLYTGNFEPYQGIDLLVASAERVLRQRQDAVFVFLGGKPDQVQHYQDRVERQGLSAHFRFTGMRPPEEIPGALHLSDILVSPRISGTNTPLKLYGYLQAGKPIVATNLPTHTQVLDNDVAVLVDPDPEALARGILSVLDAPPLATKLGKQARQLFDDRYNYQTFIKKTDQILQMALR